jgi:hypothetical protein
MRQITKPLPARKLRPRPRLARGREPKLTLHQQRAAMMRWDSGTQTEFARSYADHHNRISQLLASQVTHG